MLRPVDLMFYLLSYFSFQRSVVLQQRAEETFVLVPAVEGTGKLRPATGLTTWKPQEVHRTFSPSHTQHVTLA